MTETTHHQILIIGGGAAGISVAARLLRIQGNRSLDIAIVEPSSQHYYQPAFTLVGAGIFDLKKTRRDMERVIPPGAKWIQDAATSFDPENNLIYLQSGKSLTYDYLVICPGVELNWSLIDGAQEALGRNGICSNYDPSHVEYTWETLKALKPKSKAFFTQAPLPFKCPGAPQKIAYLAADHLSTQGILSTCDLNFFNHGPGMFAVPYFAKELVKVAENWGIKTHFHHNLIAVDGATKTAKFQIVSGDKKGETLELGFDMLHMTPPQSPPSFVKDSVLANDAGYVDIHQNSLQHTRYKNVFALGDAGSTPNSKTAAAVRLQAPIVARNILSLINNESSLEESYDGYASCPLTTSYRKVIMAEFCYGGKITPTLPLAPSKERRINMYIKKIGLPHLYWNYMLKGYEMFPSHNTKFEE